MDWDKFLSTWMKRYDFTPEQQEAFLARFSEANQQESDEQIAELLCISESAFKKRMGAVYARVGSDHDELQGEKRRKFGVLRGILREALDRAQVPELPNPIAGYAEVSTLLKRAKLGLERHSGADFYDGTEATWADIAAGCDVERDVQADLLAFVKERGDLGGPLPIGVVLGRSGDGKSTLLMRVAVALHERGDRVLWHDADHLDLNVEALEALSPRRRVVICIDDAQWIDPEVWDRGLRRLHQSGAGVLLLLGARRELWSGSKQIPRSRAVVQEFAIDHLSDAEIDRFLSTYSAADALGKLAYLSPEARVEKFRERADRQLLVMLLEAKYNESLTSYVQKTLEDLAERFGSKVVRACRLVAALHTFGIRFPKRDLATLLGVDELGTEILAKTKGFLVAEGYHHLKTRHAVIATVVFQNDNDDEEDRYLRLSQFIEADLQQPSNSDFTTPRLMHNFRLQAKALGLQVEPLREVFEKAVDCGSIRRFVYNIWAVMESGLKNHEQARKLFQAATKADPNDAPAWQAWAVMEKELKNHEQARKLFEAATKADPNHAPAWQAWAVMEKELKNHEQARKLFQAATKADPNHAPAWQAWAVMEKELKDYPQARKLFQAATKADPVNVMNRQAWEQFEKKHGTIETRRQFYQVITSLLARRHEWLTGYLNNWAILEKDAGNPDRAAELFQQTLELKPQNSHAWQSWAIMEKERGNYEKADQLFAEAIQVNPDNLPAWQARALMQFELSNIDLARNLFKTASQRSLPPKISPDQVNHNKAALYQPWSRLELSQGNSTKALKLAEQAVQLRKRGHYGYLARGKAYHKLGNWEAAQKDWITARNFLGKQLQKSPNDNRLLNQIAEIHTLLGDYEAAQAAIDQSLAVSSPGQQVHAYNALGDLRLAQGQPTAARAAWETALRLNPHNLKARNQLQALTMHPSSP
ncbi:tetratricopeptide repeat protein [Limnothrix sp. FACHB-1083]|uniref:tetratricopeptide repeat protein n=1 Tax=unclassified Limnothrix TaxID=2632864 RepID=UPI0016802A24|nr:MULTISPECIES: ATP-binding protein [unclassified Limnothrix]MBD2161254.1 tetratricopeptide repeat protein [Limnothrix sp. FACHB-1083]MBD2193637.1 tetratricopeptide repeat protein [Limnothrix sp. FACHB-1088]